MSSSSHTAPFRQSIRASQVRDSENSKESHLHGRQRPKKGILNPNRELTAWGARHSRRHGDRAPWFRSERARDRSPGVGTFTRAAPACSPAAANLRHTLIWLVRARPQANSRDVSLPGAPALPGRLADRPAWLRLRDWNGARTMCGLVVKCTALIVMIHAFRLLGRLAGPKWSALALGLPSTTAIVLVVSGCERGIAAATEMAGSSLLGLAAAVALPLAYAQAVRLGSRSAGCPRGRGDRIPGRRLDARLPARVWCTAAPGDRDFRHCVGRMLGADTCRSPSKVTRVPRCRRCRRWACARPYRRSMSWCSRSSSASPARAGRAW